MRTKSTNTTLLILTILLCLVVVGLGAYTYTFYNQVKENEAQLLKEKAIIAQELEEEISRYAVLLEEKNAIREDLVSAKERLEALQQELDSNEITRNIVQQYQIEIRQLRRERESFFLKNDSLQKETERLARLQEQTQTALDNLTKAQDSIQGANESLQEKLTQNSEITGSNLLARGVIQRNSGKFVNTSRASRAQMVRICYDINENQLATAGELTLYIQVLTSQGNMIGVQREVTFPSGERLSYNSQTTVDYTNERFGVCELVLPIQKLDKDDYTVNVFLNNRLLLTDILPLK